jgi:tetratricopeptide (TPR) repeat protein
MRRIYEQLKASLSQFVKQRDYLMLLVPCADVDTALLLKALRDLDRESPSDLFLLFADEFHSQAYFVTGVGKHLCDEHEMTASTAQTPAQQLPPLPVDLMDESRLPSVRIRAAFSYGRSLINPAAGQHAVWGLCPATIADATAHHELLADLLPQAVIEPWMRGARIVARVAPDFDLHSSPFSCARRVQIRPFSIPEGAQEEELQSAVSDPNAPLDMRMQAEIQLAYLDYGYGRFDLALHRFLRALAYYQWAEIPAQEALIISGLGDVARAEGNWHDARHWYECAVVPAAKTGNAMLMATVVQNLAVIAFVENRFSDSEDHYAELVTLKRAMIDEVGLVEALEWQGLSQEQQGGYDRAIVCWEEGALICRAFEMKSREPVLLGHLRRGYENLGMSQELESFDSEWGLQG